MRVNKRIFAGLISYNSCINTYHTQNTLVRVGAVSNLRVVTDKPPTPRAFCFMNIETWKPIVGFEHRYEVSDMGRVFSKIRNKILSPSKAPNGYLRITLTNGDSDTKHISVHRLVAISFFGKHPAYNEVNHINGIKTDNRVCNLEWCNRSENMKHAIMLRNNYGGRHVNATKVIALDKGGNYINTYNSIIEASKELHVHRVNITKVCKGLRKSSNGYVFVYAN